MKTTYGHIFEFPQSLQKCVEYLILWGKSDTDSAHRVTYRQPGAPFIDSKIQVIELSRNVMEVSFFDGRLPEEVRDSAMGLVMYAKLDELPGDRVRVTLFCAADDFIPHYRTLLKEYGESHPTLEPDATPSIATQTIPEGEALTTPAKGLLDAHRRAAEELAKEEGGLLGNILKPTPPALTVTEVHHHHYHEGQPATVAQTEPGGGALPMPDALLKSLPGNRGGEQWWAAYFDWEMEYRKQYRWTNKNGYDLLGYSKSEYDRRKGFWKAEHGAE
jgi:hypothetical protein